MAQARAGLCCPISELYARQLYSFIHRAKRELELYIVCLFSPMRALVYTRGRLSRGCGTHVYIYIAAAAAAATGGGIHSRSFAKDKYYSGKAGGYIVGRCALLDHTIEEETTRRPLRVFFCFYRGNVSAVFGQRRCG